MEIGEKFLPVGTVCLLQNGTKKVMITGFCIKSPETEDRVFDYIGCLYPEGVISSDQNLLFDHNQIVQVFFKGYVSEEETSFKNKLKELLSSEEASNSDEMVDTGASIESLEDDNSEEPVAEFVAQ